MSILNEVVLDAVMDSEKTMLSLVQKDKEFTFKTVKQVEKAIKKTKSESNALSYIWNHFDLDENEKKNFEKVWAENTEKLVRLEAYKIELENKHG